MPKTAFLFPGQGAQQIGMGVKVAEKYPAARQLFDQAADILGFDLLKLCAQGPEERIHATEISQPALYVSSLASLEVVKDQSSEALGQVEVAAGLSLGEYTALAFAGAMSFEDGLRVVRVRGQAMQAAADATPSGMVSLLLLDEEKVQQVCEKASDAGLIQIANYLCPGNIVVSGDQAACEKVVGIAEEAGGRAIPLKVAGAFHTPIMQSATEKLANVLESVQIQAPRIPVVSNVDAKTHSDAAEIREILVKQVVHPVLWEKSMNALLEMGVEQFYEIGPGKVLKGLMKRIARKASVENFNDESIE
ncbi:ACP S-malonyltransferase [Rubinisphaera sp.]|uniref:ACP S-malonyltransferase n=1 Tax=Rubinisphaera sp. TaxID=2024857 RepID=UPI000C0F70BC|nr:ACP S-malonyltransferase [Rubinisphaera sp.]MBV10315.1 [acyl-carrier-protein] S-malonyltransferase [Rubinisphaera sp.]HCS54049.1 [acyl-carrier-protein] S-malonyltransferase [Planctomycetaceae bacterium]|tara:strand:+ start:13501 stop:14418 length:918 start_codon:yes stop_codon:yes gene_type:complete